MIYQETTISQWLLFMRFNLITRNTSLILIQRLDIYLLQETILILSGSHQLNLSLEQIY